jgi:predicted nuclease of predicted toxin-antitoxin system
VIVWVDAQLAPSLAPWIRQQFGIDAASVRHLGLRDAKDRQIFAAARDANAVVLSKDVDFVLLLERFGPPPSILWVRCGNTSNANLRKVLSATFLAALALIRAGESLVEISDELK